MITANCRQVAVTSENHDLDIRSDKLEACRERDCPFCSSNVNSLAVGLHRDIPSPLVPPCHTKLGIALAHQGSRLAAAARLVRGFSFLGAGQSAHLLDTDEPL